MTCPRAREQIVRLDAREAPSPSLARHLAECADCRRLYERLRSVEAVARIASPVERAGVTTPDAVFTARVMRSIHEADAEPRAAISAVGLRGWTAGSAAILASLVVVQFSDVVEWLRGSLGPIIDVALATMLGLTLTIYILILVGSNLSAVRRALKWLTG